jgi:hypothetical protein
MRAGGYFRWVSFGVLGFAVVGVLVGGRASAPGALSPHGRMQLSFARLPLAFEPMRDGRTYVGRAAASGVAVHADGATFALRHGSGTRFVRMRLLGARPSSLTPQVRLQGTVNEFLGSDPSRWRVGVPTFGSVRSGGVYPGIDPFQPSHAAGSSDDVFVTKLDPAGALVYSTYLGGSAMVGVNGGDGGLGIAVDSAGAVYLTGYTRSADFPITAGGGSFTNSQDAFVTKINAAGNALVYSRYLGGSAFNVGRGISVDGSGNAYVGGYTQSVDFPTTAGAFDTTYNGADDGFVTKVDSTGVIAYSTFLGTTGDDFLYGIAASSAGNAYVTGYTPSTAFPTQNPIQGSSAGGDEAYVTEFNTAGNGLVYSTYLGGSLVDHGFGIALDSSADAFVVGFTNSTNFPTMNPYQPAHAGAVGTDDAFVTKVAAGGASLIYSTYLGGSSDDEGQGIAVSSTGDAYITGYTTSSNFPMLNAVQPAEAGSYDAFVSSLRSAGNNLAYSTYLGGSGADFGIAIGTDPTGNATVSGGTSSTNFPTMNPAQMAAGGNQDAFVAKLPYVPTAVEVRAFTAVRVGHAVRLRWSTGSEAGVAGFRVLRNGRRLTGLIAAVSSGHRYEYVDRHPGARPVYTLELVRLDGGRIAYRAVPR